MRFHLAQTDDGERAGSRKQQEGKTDCAQKQGTIGTAGLTPTTTVRHGRRHKRPRVHHARRQHTAEASERTSTSSGGGVFTDRVITRARQAAAAGLAPAPRELARPWQRGCDEIRKIGERLVPTPPVERPPAETCCNELRNTMSLPQFCASVPGRPPPGGVFLSVRAHPPTWTNGMTKTRP